VLEIRAIFAAIFNALKRMRPINPLHSPTPLPLPNFNLHAVLAQPPASPCAAIAYAQESGRHTAPVRLYIAANSNWQRELQPILNAPYSRCTPVWLYEALVPRPVQ
jgi:hypothetical protein